MSEAAGINFDRRGSGSPLVLVHGIGSRWEVWQPVLDALAARHDVISVDLPGFGATPAPPKGTAPGIPTFADAMERFFAALGLSRPHVAGNSMGGWIALELARRGQVASATGISPAGFHKGLDRVYVVPTLTALRLTAQATRGLAPTLLKSAEGRKAAFSMLVAHPERMTPAEAVGGSQGLADATWFWPNLWELPQNTFPDAPDIDVPVTIAWGDKDHLLFPRQAATALAKIPAAKFVALPDCGHVPMYDNPQLVAETILATTGAAT